MDGMQWFMEHRRIDALHYLDDFLIISSPEAMEKDDLGHLGFMQSPGGADKIEGLATIIMSRY